MHYNQLSDNSKSHCIGGMNLPHPPIPNLQQDREPPPNLTSATSPSERRMSRRSHGLNPIPSHTIRTDCCASYQQESRTVCCSSLEVLVDWLVSPRTAPKEPRRPRKKRGRGCNIANESYQRPGRSTDWTTSNAGVTFSLSNLCRRPGAICRLRLRLRLPDAIRGELLLISVCSR